MSPGQTLLSSLSLAFCGHRLKEHCQNPINCVPSLNSLLCARWVNPLAVSLHLLRFQQKDQVCLWPGQKRGMISSRTCAVVVIRKSQMTIQFKGN